MATRLTAKTTQGNNYTIYDGIVLEDKSLTSRDIKVFIQELNPFQGGYTGVAEEDVQLTNSAESSKASFNNPVKTTNYVTAHYFGLDTNRAMPPDVVKDEHVVVFNFSDSDTYYWFSKGRDDNLRQTERYRVQIADIKTVVKILSSENTYFFEMDSTKGNKRIILQTAKTDGEQYRYTFMLDVEHSRIIIADDDDNLVQIDSTIPRVLMKNKNGSCLDINANDIFVAAIDSLVLKAGAQIVEEAPVKTEQQGRGDQTSVFQSKSAGYKCDNTFMIEAPCVGIQGALVVDSIVAKNVVSESGFSTGSRGPMYNAPSTDIASASGSSCNNTPNPGGGGEGNRHCVAWEDFIKFAENICSSVSCNCGLTGCPDNTGAALAAAQASKMPKNKGE